MSDLLPLVTIIIAARPDQAEIRAVIAARRLDYPADRLEIIVARGKQPSVQRNTAIRAAKGELIYFLDDDSVPPPSNLRQAVQLFTDSSVKMAGGPNLCPPDAPALEQIFAVVLASWLAFGPSRARYARIGKARVSGEKELILCNLLVRREAILEFGGFNEALYPNEENALMDEIQKRGGKLIYDPELFVHRRPRPSLAAFFKMLRTYGRGRAEQFRLHPTFGSAPNFVPPLFCFYLAALLVFALIPTGDSLARIKIWAAAPLGLYLVAIALQTIASFPSHGLVRSVLAMPLLVASHVFYGLGFWRGLFTH
ncbi:MAG: glycosyltransferase, partial [Akkermansiaceae bacterium]|nr:glycosyltransferase [Verrucomicrobiales bacterium]